MGIFSRFSRPDENVQGSYCDRNSKSDVEHYKGEDIDEQINNAEDRGDTVEFSKADFHDSASYQRYDDDCRQIEQGPKQR